MSEENGSEKGRVVFCTCAHYDLISQDSREYVYRHLRDSGVEFEAVADMCGLAAQNPLVLQQWARAESLKIIACFPRTVRWLFHFARAPLPSARVEIYNLRRRSAEEIAAQLSGECPSADTDISDLPQKGDDWTPWFPVIDYDRCRNCKQCLNFCLFGTYALSEEGRVQVANPANCKTNCPACARVCPHKAIIFPKYGEAPINGEELEQAEDGTGELDELLKGNVYDMIRKRGAGGKRFATARKHGNSSPPSGMEQLRKKLDIPMDVLKSLSPAEITRISRQSGRKPGDKNYTGRAKEGNESTDE